MKKILVFLFVCTFVILTVAPAYGGIFRRRCNSVYVPQNFTPMVSCYNNSCDVHHDVVTTIVQPLIIPVAPAFQFQYCPPTIGAYPPPIAPALATAPANPCLAPAAPAYGGALPTVSGPGYASGGYGGASPSFSGPNTSPYSTPMTGGPTPNLATPNSNFSQDQIKALAAAVWAEMQKQDSGPPAIKPESSYPTIKPDAPKSPDEVPALPSSQYPSTQPLYPPTTAAPSSAKPLPNSPYAVTSIAALSRNCAYCHTGGGARGDTVIFLQPGILNPDAPFRSMERELQAGRMPPRTSQFRPTAEEYSTVMAWLSGQ